LPSPPSPEKVLSRPRVFGRCSVRPRPCPMLPQTEKSHPRRRRTNSSRRSSQWSIEARAAPMASQRPAGWATRLCTQPPEMPERYDLTDPSREMIKDPITQDQRTGRPETTTDCGTFHFPARNKKPRKSLIYGVFKSGGRGRNRTGVGGFAIRCITILLLGLKRSMPYNDINRIQTGADTEAKLTT